MNTMKPLILESEEVKSNYDFVKKYIQEDPNNLKYASDELKNNLNLVEFAVSLSPSAYEFAGDKIKKNAKLALSIYRENRHLYRYFSDDLKNNETFIIELMKINPHEISEIDEKWTHNVNVMSVVVEKVPRLIRFNKSEDLVKDKDLFYRIAKNEMMDYFWFPEAILKDFDFKEKLFNENPSLAALPLLKGIEEDHPIIDKFLDKVPDFFTILPPKFRTKERSLYIFEKLGVVDDILLKHFNDVEFFKDLAKINPDFGKKGDKNEDYLKKVLLKDPEIKKVYKEFKDSQVKSAKTHKIS